MFTSLNSKHIILSKGTNKNKPICDLHDQNIKHIFISNGHPYCALESWTQIFSNIKVFNQFESAIDHKMIVDKINFHAID